MKLRYTQNTEMEKKTKTENVYKKFYFGKTFKRELIVMFKETK